MERHGTGGSKLPLATFISLPYVAYVHRGAGTLPVGSAKKNIIEINTGVIQSAVHRDLYEAHRVLQVTPGVREGDPRALAATNIPKADQLVSPLSCARTRRKSRGSS